MELIKKLDYRKNKTGVQSILWGLFLCSSCNKEVERRLNGGLRAKSCGCKRILHGETKLYMGEVIELRKICKFGGYSQKRIAKAYNISPALLSNIVNNRIWKEVINA